MRRRSIDPLLRALEADRTGRSREALPGGRTYGEVRDLLEDAIRDDLSLGDGSWVWVVDLTDEWVIYDVEADDGSGAYRRDYTVGDDGAVTLGAATKVERRTSYEPIAESIRVEGGRVIEAKGTDAAGGRVYRVQVVEAGVSRNGRAYTMDVLRNACSLYAGAKAFDHHRTIEELETSTVEGLVGHYQAPTVNPRGIEADLHLLPSASHVAEALDASLAAEAAGLPPVVGISHDVQVGGWKPVEHDGRRILEATSIDRVFSADVVADPAAGGRALRAVAGGISIEDPEEGLHMKTLKQLIEALRGADAAKRAELLAEHAALVEASGYSAEEVTMLADAPASTGQSGTEPPGDQRGQQPDGGAGSEGSEGGSGSGGAPAPELVPVAKESAMGRLLIRTALEDRKLEHLAPVVTEQLPDRFTEADLAAVVDVSTANLRALEGAGLVQRGPTVPHVAVTGEEHDKKVEKLYQTFCRNWREGYSSIVDAYIDITGARPRTFHDPELAHQIVRESWALSRSPGRASEAVNSATWGEVLGSTMYRRLIERFQKPDYQTWRQIVTTRPVNDFREHRVDRIGGFGDLPTVPEGAPYQELAAPPDEEVTLSASKKGGLQSITWETIVNDDIQALARIPDELARAAWRTLYKFVFISLFTGNPTIYDSVALFHASHNNTTAAALNAAGLATLRQKMRDQTEYGSSEPTGLTPNILVVPNELEQTAWELVNSQAKVTSNEDATVPNFNQGRYDVIVLDELTDANDWFAVAGPEKGEGIEVGFLNGREDPELLMQDDPRVGAVFSADVVTWKIRHVYGGTVVDYRPFQRGTQ